MLLHSMYISFQFSRFSKQSYNFEVSHKSIKMCVLDKCCFCCDHEKGVIAMAIIFGVCYLVIGILQMINTFYAAGAINLVLFLSTLLLLKAVNDKKRVLMLPWMILYGIIILVNLALAIYLTVELNNASFIIIQSIACKHF